MNQVSHSDSPRVLITGIDGFTGRYLTSALRELGMQVFGTSRNIDDNNKNICTLNLNDRTMLAEFIDYAQPNYVVHLAAVSFVGNAEIQPIYETNVVGTRNLLSTLSDYDGDIIKIILASSANIYGNSENDNLAEDAPFNPANDYAISKVAMEYVANLWSKTLPITIVRPFNYTGPGQSDRFLIPKIVKHFKNNTKEIELGNTDIWRDFSDVRFVADAYCKLLSSNHDNGVFNVCSGRTYSLSEIITMMEDIAGYKIRVVQNPLFIRENEVKRLGGSNDRLIKAIGKINRIDIYQTLKDMYLSN